MQSCLSLGYSEQISIRELDVETIRRNVDRMRFYYGTTDGWCPLSFYERLKKSVPELDAVVDQRGFEHAFVLNSSDEMGEIVGEWWRKDNKD